MSVIDDFVSYPGSDPIIKDTTTRPTDGYCQAAMLMEELSDVDVANPVQSVAYSVLPMDALECGE